MPLLKTRSQIFRQLVLGHHWLCPLTSLQGSFFPFLSFFKKVYLFWGGRWQRQGERENPKQALLAWSPTWGSNSQTVRSWPELKSRVGHSTNWATRRPYKWFYKNNSKFGFRGTSVWLSDWLLLSCVISSLITSMVWSSLSLRLKMGISQYHIIYLTEFL